VEKYSKAGQATDDKMAQAHFTLRTSKYVILIAFPLQQWLHERAHNITLYLHYRSCYSRKRKADISTSRIWRPWHCSVLHRASL